MPDAVHPGNPPQLVRSFQLYIDASASAIPDKVGNSLIDFIKRHFVNISGKAELLVSMNNIRQRADEIILAELIYG